MVRKNHGLRVQQVWHEEAPHLESFVNSIQQHLAFWEIIPTKVFGEEIKEDGINLLLDGCFSHLFNCHFINIMKQNNVMVLAIIPYHAAFGQRLTQNYEESIQKGVPSLRHFLY